MFYCVYIVFLFLFLAEIMIEKISFYSLFLNLLHLCLVRLAENKISRAFLCKHLIMRWKSPILSFVQSVGSCKHWRRTDLEKRKPRSNAYLNCKNFSNFSIEIFAFSPPSIKAFASENSLSTLVLEATIRTFF